MAKPKCQYKVSGVGKGQGAWLNLAHPWGYAPPAPITTPGTIQAGACTQGLHRPGGNCLFSHTGRAGGARGHGCHQPAVTAGVGPGPPVRAGQPGGGCQQWVGVLGEHHPPEPDGAALGVPTPCVTPREDLLIVPLQDTGWKKEVMRDLVLCDTHLLDDSSPADAAGAIAAGAVRGQRVPVPGTQLTRVPSCDKDTRDKDTAVPAPCAALQRAPLAPGWGGLIQSFPSQEGGMSFPAAPSPLQCTHMFWDRRVDRILLWDHTSPPAAHGAGDREMWVPTISPVHMSIVG